MKINGPSWSYKPPTEDYTLCFFRVVQHSIPPIINYYYMKDQWTLVCEGEAFCVFFFGRREAFSVWLYSLNFLFFCHPNIKERILVSQLFLSSSIFSCTCNVLRNLKFPPGNEFNIIEWVLDIIKRDFLKKKNLMWRNSC